MPISFPEPYSANNPSIGAAADFASRAASVYNGLQSALSQRAALVQQQQDHADAVKQQGLADQLKAYSEGWVPALGQASPTATDPATGHPTLMTPPDSDYQGTAAPDSAYSYDPARTKIIGDAPMYKPTEDEAAAVTARAKKKAEPPLDDTNSFKLTNYTAAAANAAEGGGNYAAGQRLPFSQRGFVTDAVKASLAKSAKKPEEFFTVNTEASKRLKAVGINIDEGAMVSREHAANAIDLFKIAYPPEEKQPTAREPHIARMENRQTGDVTEVATDPQTGEELYRNTYKGAAGIGKDPNAPKPPTKSDFVRIQAKKATDLAAAKTKFLAAVKDASPEDKSAAAANYGQDLANAQSNYEQSIQQATGHEVPHNAWAENPNLPLPADGDTQQLAAPAATPAGPSFMDRIKGWATGNSNSPQSAAPAKAAPPSGATGASGAKTVSEADLSAYVAAQNQAGNRQFTMDDAKKEAKQRGLAVIPKPVDQRAVHASAAGGH